VLGGARARGLEPAWVDDFRSITGKGVVGKVGGRTVALGNAALLADLGMAAGPLAARAEVLRGEGQTVMLVGVDGRPAGNWGAWESTGIVDASAAFGPGAFLINVQAHTLWVEKAPGDDNNGDGQPDFTYKREGGQLLLIRNLGI